MFMLDSTISSLQEMSNHICTCAALFFRKGGSSWDGTGSASAALQIEKDSYGRFLIKCWVYICFELN